MKNRPLRKKAHARKFWARKKTKPTALRRSTALSCESLEPREVLSASSGIVATPDFLDTEVNMGSVTQIAWEKGIYTDRTLDGSSTQSIPFGLSLPEGYLPDEATEYPLVLYLHGKGAAENDTNKQLTRQTTRFFAANAQKFPAENAFILAPQAAEGAQWVDISLAPEDSGPYTQDATTYSDSLRLTEDLIDFLTHDRNHTNLMDALGLDAADIDVGRIYVVGDSMGSFGVWDLLARNPNRFAAGMASSGSGPLNKMSELLQTPLWAMHGAADTVVPNGLQGQIASDGQIYANGAGSLGTLQSLDPTFMGTVSTSVVYVDDRTQSTDDPQSTESLVYTEFDNTFVHSKVAKQWTDLVPGVRNWLFAQARTPVSVARGDMNSDGAVDSQDTNPFLLALTNYAEYTATYPEIYLDVVGDVNGDGAFNFGDLGAFRLAVAAGSAEAENLVSEETESPSETSPKHDLPIVLAVLPTVQGPAIQDPISKDPGPEAPPKIFQDKSPALSRRFRHFVNLSHRPKFVSTLFGLSDSFNRFDFQKATSTIRRFRTSFARNTRRPHGNLHASSHLIRDSHERAQEANQAREVHSSHREHQRFRERLRDRKPNQLESIPSRDDHFERGLSKNGVRALALLAYLAEK